MPSVETNTSLRVPASQPLDRLLIIDDDVCFGALMNAVSPKYGFQPRYFPSLVDMGSFARIKDFDLAVVDYFLGHLRGDEIAEYVDTFFNGLPVIIVSAEASLEDPEKQWPESVRVFVPKTAGPDYIAQTARRVLNRDRMLRKLREHTPDSCLHPGA